MIAELRPRWLILTLALGTAVGGLVGRHQAEANRAEVRAHLDGVAEALTLRLEERATAIAARLGGLGAVVAEHGPAAVDRAKFAEAVAALDLGRTTARPHAVGVAVRVAADDEDVFAAALRAQDDPAFRVSALAPHEGDRFVVRLADPRDDRGLLGLDLASEPRRRAAALAALASGRPTLSAPLTAARGGAPHCELMMLVPILRAGAAPRGAAERDAATVGWALALTSSDELVEGAGLDGAAVSIRDADGAVVYDGASRADPAAERTERAASLMGRRWVLSVAATPAFEASLHAAGAPRAALTAGGLTFAVLTLALGLGAASRRRRASLERQLQTRTAELDSTRKDAELALAETTSLLTRVLESASELAIIAVDPSLRITLFNAGAARLTGYAAGEVVGHKGLLELFDAAELARVAPAPAAWLTAPDALGSAREFTWTTDGGRSVDVSLIVTAMRSDAGELRGYLAVAQDIAPQKAAERAVRDAMHRAQQAREAKSQFLASVSHEIRTPMNAVIGLTHVLRHTALSADQADLLNKISVSSRALMAIINDVLDLSKIEAGELHLEHRPFALSEVLADLREAYAVQAERKGIALTMQARADVPERVVGDPARMAQIVNNLVSNALKFTARGAVTVRVEALETTAAACRVRFSVEDTGIGIPSELHDELFAPFAQADASTTRRFGGTGLGLSIVKRLASMMGGTVGLRSTPGQGSTFWVDLPLLLADDGDSSLEVARRILEAEGARVRGVPDGARAVETLRAEPDAFDAAILDVHMPAPPPSGGAPGPAEAEPWPNVRGLDESARARLMGDVGLLRALLRQLLADNVGLAEGLARRPAAEIAPRVHKLAGASGALGAVDLHRAATAWSAAFRAGAPLSEPGEALARELEALARSASAWVGTSEPVAVARPPTASELRGLIALMQSSDLAALPRFRALEGPLRGALGAPAFRELRALVEQLAFTEAAAVLSRLPALTTEPRSTLAP